MVKKCTNIYHLLCSAMISLAFVLSTQIIVDGGMWGTKDENYINPYGWKSLVLFVVTMVVVDILISFAFDYIRIFFKKIQGKQVYTDKKLLNIWTGINVIAWIPYYLSYYPGGVYSDTFTSVEYYYTGLRTNRHPLLYNYMVGFFIKLSEWMGQGLNFAFGMFFLVQMIVMIIELRLFNRWMQKKEINKVVVNITMFGLIFWPLLPLSVVSIWKDTEFCMAFLFWFMVYVDLLQEIHRSKVSVKTIILFVVGEVLVAFTRNNGIYVVMLTALLLLIFTIRTKFDKKRATVIAIVASVAGILLVQGPIYNLTGVQQTDAVEKYGIPLQQIGSVVAYNGDISQEQLETLNQFIPVGNIAEHYSPCLVDNLKWYAGLNNEYLKDHQKEFLQLWWELLLQNPKLYVRAYLLQTVGYWDVDVADYDGYVQTYVWNNSGGVVATDYFERIFGFSFQHFVNPRSYISNAWFFWLFLICTLFCMKYFGFKKVLYFVPQLGVWLTLMIATPTAWSLRYISALLFTLPFVVLIPILLSRESES